MRSAESLSSIKAWANSSFANDFTTLETYVKSQQFTFIKFPAIENMSCHASPARSERGIAIQVGTVKSSGTAVYAGEIRGGIKLGFKGEVNTIRIQEDDTDQKINLIEPFSWVAPYEDEAGFARLEALVRYIFLTKNRPFILLGNISRFKEHLPSACRDIAEHTARKLSSANNHKRSYLLKLKLPRNPANATAEHLASTPHIPIPQPAPHTAQATSPPSSADQHLQTLTQTISTLLSQTTAAQAATRRELATLHAKIADLEASLAEALQKQKQDEAQRAELADGIAKAEQRTCEARKAGEASRAEAVSARERAERAEGEAGRVRDEYEGLRRVLEGALGRRG